MGEARSAVERFYEAFNVGRLEDAREVAHEDIENIDPSGTIKGWDAFLQYISAFKGAMPDARLNPKSFIEAGDTVAVEGTFSGTFTNPLPGPQGELQPTGKSFELPYVEINQLEGGKVKSHRVYYDQMAFMTALGAMPS